jgi:hypothetical protein
LENLKRFICFKRHGCPEIASNAANKIVCSGRSLGKSKQETNRKTSNPPVIIKSLIDPWRPFFIERKIMLQNIINVKTPNSERIHKKSLWGLLNEVL